MPPFFPQVTGTFRLEEPPALRRFSMSLVEMALVTGVVLRLGWALAFTQGPSDSLLFAGAVFALRFIALFGMAALHLGNFTLRHWVWRAPLFAAVEALAEALTSLGLIALHREPLGSARATFADWPAMASGTLFWRLAAVIAFSLLLAGVVQLVRYSLLKRAHRDHTVAAVHHERPSEPRGAEPGGREPRSPA
jgi:signal transduction histidine kinase